VESDRPSPRLPFPRALTKNDASKAKKWHLKLLNGSSYGKRDIRGLSSYAVSHVDHETLCGVYESRELRLQANGKSPRRGSH
jgi:hypothetical protein